MADTEPVLDLSELLELYKTDARQTVDKMRASFLRWGEVVTGGAARQELRKWSHQLRGSGRTYGFRDVTRVSKAIERIMERLDKGRVQPEIRVQESLGRKIDRLAQIFQTS